jgi:K+-transporting ATPase ATPase C chain
MSNHDSDTAGNPSSPAYPPICDGGLLRGSLALAIISVLGFGLLYPLAGVGVGQALFPHTANGSLIEHDGRVLGSALVAQPFTAEIYFQPRPSAAGYDAMAVSGSNQARSNPDLRQRIEAARSTVAATNGIDPSAVPSDLVTQSGGGIDPHITPESAALQVARVARARAMRPAAVEALLQQHTEPRQFGVLGQPRVNVLQLNLALDADPSATAAR